MQKRAQSAGSSAVLVIVIAALIIIYILFLPPDERDRLLEDSPSPGSGPSPGPGGYPPTTIQNNTLLFVTPGALTHLKYNEREHDLPSFRILTSTNAGILESAESIFVKNSAFEKTSDTLTFSLDPGLSENVQLSFNIKDAEGRLIVYLNGEQIVEDKYSVGSPAPIQLPSALLEEENELFFTVSSPGWAFWLIHQYLLTSIQVTADLTDISRSESTQTFFLSDEEKTYMDEATLFFFPDCTLSEAGPLSISLNGRRIFSAVADCGVRNHIELNPTDLVEGENELEFVSYAGSYLIDQLSVKVDLEDEFNPLYTFYMDRTYFVEKDLIRARCGDVDGKCPADCEADEDKDCCFDEEEFWCDVEPERLDDRCVSFIDIEDDCNRCAAGYEDKRGNPPEPCEDLCGDDTDDDCPASCSVFYDKDCCYEDTEDNFWCDDVPAAGLGSVCEEAVSSTECDDCPNGYRDGDRSRPKPCTNIESDSELEEYLDIPYDVDIRIRFGESNIRKRFTLSINGMDVAFDTRDIEVNRNIDSFVRSGSNSLEIIPDTDFTISEIEIELDYS
ncbi:hypothetical protein CMO92_03945 [Candidatus Woesearchaeota archaeon]|nr:hypothetical protein [Candidatus Woesearchaeota archaeon]